MKSTNKKITVKTQETNVEATLAQKSSKTLSSVDMGRDFPSTSDYSPFQKSAKVKRTPPANTLLNSELSTDGKNSYSRDSSPEPSPRRREPRFVSPAISGVLAGGPVGSPEQADMEDACRRVDEELKRMRGVIAKMKGAASRQRNMSTDVKDGLLEIEESVEVVQALRGFWSVALQRLVRLSQAKLDKPKSKDIVSVSTQTPLADKGLIATQNMRVARKVEVEVPLVDLGENTTPNEWVEVRPKRVRAPRKGGVREEENRMEEAGLSGEVGKIPERANPRTKRNRREKGPPRTRPDAVLIKPAEGKSYAEVLKELRERIKPEDVGAEVSRIRQTRAGDILVELGAETKDKVAFGAALNAVLQEKATATCLEPRTTVEIRDLDALADEEEIRHAVEQQVGGNPGDLRIHLTKASSRGLKAAIVQLSVRIADKLEKEGTLRVGWVRCRVRRRITVLKCFKCLSYGHMSAACAGPDRSNLCYKCGNEGHLAAVCTADISCMLCRNRGLENKKCQHILGSGDCTVFRQALEQAKKKFAIV